MEKSDLYFDFTDTTYATLLEDEWEEFPLEVFCLIKVISIIIYSITFILGIVGNGLVIWIAGFKMKKNVNTIWFLNLGVADFTFNIFFPFQITEWAMDGHWPFGQIMCKIMSTVLFLNMAVSTSFLMVISADRCTSVLCPVWSKNHRDCRLAYTISFVIWLLCLILSSPYVAFFNTEADNDDNNSYCYMTPAVWNDSMQFNYEIRKRRDNAMYVTRLVSMFLIPFSIILVCYGLISFKLRKRKSLSGSGRPFKIIIIIVLCFFCCWFLFHFWPMLEFLDIETDWKVDFIVSNIALCLAYFNSCLNPILYVFIGRDFKRSLMKSIPFLLESTFKERFDLYSENQCDQTTGETELETVHL
ncbi:N-formyl peptide receptor 2-like [Discoglossus pictus]